MNTQTMLVTSAFVILVGLVIFLFAWIRRILGRLERADHELTLHEMRRPEKDFNIVQCPVCRPGLARGREARMPNCEFCHNLRAVHDHLSRTYLGHLSCSGPGPTHRPQGKAAYPIGGTPEGHPDATRIRGQVHSTGDLSMTALGPEAEENMRHWLSHAAGRTILYINMFDRNQMRMGAQLYEVCE